MLNSDTIILLHVPEGGAAAVAFSIPRDSYVDIPGYRRDKINAAYPAVKALTAERLVGEGVRDRGPDRRGGREGRPDRADRDGGGLTGVTVDHYAEINLLGFYNLTTAIGGVDVCLKNAVDEPLSGARFPAGPQTVSGADALAFVRQRHGLPEGDLSRIRRQQVFLAAVADKVLSGGTLTDPAKLAGLVQVAQQSVVLDAGWDLLAFARQASDIAAGNLEFLTIPTGGPRPTPAGSVVLVDPARGARPSSSSAASPSRRPRADRGGRPPRRRRSPRRRWTIEAPHYVVRRAQRVGGDRAGRRRCCRPAPRASASSAARWTTRPTPRRRSSATPGRRRRGRRGRRAARRDRGGAGRRPCRPGTCRSCWGRLRPGRIPGLARRRARRPPRPTAPNDHGGRRTVHRLIAPTVPKRPRDADRRPARPDSEPAPRPPGR